MPQLAIMDYSTGKIEIINLSQETYNKYERDFDEYVFGVLDYRESDVYYMVSSGIIKLEVREE